MVNPLPAFTASAGTTVLIALMTATAVSLEVFTVPTCSGIDDWLGGCDNLLSKVLSYGVLGTIPGAHPALNAIMAVMGLSMRATIIWSVIRLFLGGG